jgi:hypothetical protein
VQSVSEYSLPQNAKQVLGTVLNSSESAGRAHRGFRLIAPRTSYCG